MNNKDLNSMSLKRVDTAFKVLLITILFATSVQAKQGTLAKNAFAVTFSSLCAATLAGAAVVYHLNPPKPPKVVTPESIEIPHVPNVETTAPKTIDVYTEALKPVETYWDKFALPLAGPHFTLREPGDVITDEVFKLKFRTEINFSLNSRYSLDRYLNENKASQPIFYVKHDLLEESATMVGLHAPKVDLLVSSGYALFALKRIQEYKMIVGKDLHSIAWAFTQWIPKYEKEILALDFDEDPQIKNIALKLLEYFHLDLKEVRGITQRMQYLVMMESLLVKYAKQYEVIARAMMKLAIDKLHHERERGLVIDLALARKVQNAVDPGEELREHQFIAQYDMSEREYRWAKQIAIEAVKLAEEKKLYAVDVLVPDIHVDRLIRLVNRSFYENSILSFIRAEKSEPVTQYTFPVHRIEEMLRSLFPKKPFTELAKKSATVEEIEAANKLKRTEEKQLSEMNDEALLDKLREILQNNKEDIILN